MTEKKSVYLETSVVDNAETKPIVRRVCATHGYSGPEICTPQELMGVIENG